MLSQNVLIVTIPPYKVSNPTNGGGHQIGGGGGGVTRGGGHNIKCPPIFLTTLIMKPKYCTV